MHYSRMGPEPDLPKCQVTRRDGTDALAPGQARMMYGYFRQFLTMPSSECGAVAVVEDKLGYVHTYDLLNWQVRFLDGTHEPVVVDGQWCEDESGMNNPNLKTPWRQTPICDRCDHRIAVADAVYVSTWLLQCANEPKSRTFVPANIRRLAQRITEHFSDVQPGPEQQNCEPADCT